MGELDHYVGRAVAKQFPGECKDFVYRDFKFQNADL